jgi:signal transduction histidine kinase
LFPRLGFSAVAIAAMLVAIFAVTVLLFRSELQREIHRKIIERDAAVLYPVALQQLADRAASTTGRTATAAELVTAVLKSAAQEGMLAIAVFDGHGELLQSLPASLLLPELPADDYGELLGAKPISRYHPALPLGRYFTGANMAKASAPVLEVLLPLHGREPLPVLGFAQYYIDARPLAGELAAIDQRVNRETAVTLGLGIALIVATVAVAYVGLARARRAILERNERLRRANFELTLAVKASALGQITSHLLHGLQGSVAGLRAAVAAHDANPGDSADWQSAAAYTERLQSMVEEVVAMLGDTQASVSYELTGHDLAATIRQRNAAAANARGVRLDVSPGFNASIDSHRGGLLCLIATNLVQNAIEATAPGDRVAVELRVAAGRASVVVSDEGAGIPPEVCAHLFTPGRSGRTGGTGLGLAISRLLARQIGADLTLESTGRDGTVFSVRLPVHATTEPS